MLTNEPKQNDIETLPNGYCFELVFVEGGTFDMGSEQYDREQPIHAVTVPDFYCGKYLVTQGLWKAVMGDHHNPSYFQGDERPVETVSWQDAQEFIQKLNALTGQSYRLPSEAEWEYAARGGAKSKRFEFAGGKKLKEVGWYWNNSHNETKPVGLKLPNELGLYDMSGNVWEWCEDIYHDNYDGAPKDGSAWLKGGEQARRVVRGGSWFDYVGSDCRVSDRDGGDNDYRDFVIGFRLCRY